MKGNGRERDEEQVQGSTQTCSNLARVTRVLRYAHAQCLGHTHRIHYNCVLILGVGDTPITSHPRFGDTPIGATPTRCGTRL